MHCLNYNTMKTILKILPAALLAASCSGFFNMFSESIDIRGDALPHDMIVLGDQLEDPYTVENMTKALESIYSTRADRYVVQTTDLYVRFLPKSDDEFDKLESLGVRMMDHPLDYEILREGDWYHDPSIEEGEITWQYAVVGKDFVFPEGIVYEILDECFLPENASTKAEWVDWEAVEKEAFILTGNGSMLESPTKAGGDGFVPEGRITIVDEALGTEVSGVKGVTVSCNVFVKTAHAFTDEEGNYRMSKSFSSAPRYRLLFKNKKGFGIGMNLLLVPASSSTMGKGDPSGVSLQVDSNSDRRLFERCAVNNAAYDYYESCIADDSSIKTPPANLRIWLFNNLDASSSVMMQQGALIDGSVITEYLGPYSALIKMFLPDLTLGLKNAASYADIFAVTVHELAHASHFMQVGTSYWDSYIEFVLLSFVTSGFVTYGVGTEKNHGYCEVGEMWAYYMQTVYMKERYGTDRQYGTSYWFYPQILTRLDERGINRYKIFNALTQDICDKESLQKKLISLYPESKSVINQAFGKYN